MDAGQANLILIELKTLNAYMDRIAAAAERLSPVGDTPKPPKTVITKTPQQWSDEAKAKDS